MDECVLVLAPKGRDAEVICRLLAGAGIGCLSVSDLTKLPPVILITGDADTKAVERVVGAEAIPRKPFKVEDLANSLRRALA
jgi:hypothetical protein